MRSVVSEWPNLQRNSYRSPSRVRLSRHRVDCVMNIDRKVEQAASPENSYQFLHDRRRRFSVVNYIVANNEVKTFISEWQLLAKSRDSCCALLPGEKCSIAHGQRINAHPATASEIKDQPVSPPTNFNHSC